MPLLTLQRASLAFGDAPLLDAADFTLDAGERVAVIGRNGVGKSTLLAVLQGLRPLDDGRLQRHRDARVAMLPQTAPPNIRGTVRDVILQGLADRSQRLRDYHGLAAAVSRGEADPAALNAAQAALDTDDGWLLEQRSATVLSRLALDPEQPFETLSGGLQRRVLLGQALVNDPNVLLLDEPTNHLDLAAIEWLETLLLGFRGAILTVSHDRSFLNRIATRLIELDRGQLTSFPGNFAAYQRRKTELLANEARAHAEFDKTLAQEERWIRQGVKARRTRNEGRVRALERMRRERQARRERQGDAEFSLAQAERSGKLVIEAQGLCHAWPERQVLRDLDLTLLRGDKIGILGPNGAGKTTLIRVLLGRLPADRGRLRHGSRLQIAYFDQTRAALNPEQTVLDNLDHGKDTVTVNGRQRHIVSYLQDFLFDAQQLRQPVKRLSGGERNRLLLARLFLTPANLLVMDEPTNDLDIETLELLEALLVDYRGTLLLVSHDRTFLDHVVTATLAYEGQGRWSEYVGGYQDWLRQRPPVAADTAAAPRRARAKAAAPPPRQPAKTKLSYKDQRELDSLPQRIETLEAEQAALTAAMSNADFFRQPSADIQAAQQTLARLTADLDAAYQRWAQLER